MSTKLRILPWASMNLDLSADFGISEINLNKETATDTTLQSSSLEILFVMEGGVKIKSDKSELSLHRGQAAAVLPDTVYTISTLGDALIYKAFVP